MSTRIHMTLVELKRQIHDKNVVFSQRTISEYTTDGWHIGKLAESIERHGWQKGNSVTAVEIAKGILVMIDHRRILAVLCLPNTDATDGMVVPIVVHKENDRLSNRQAKRFEISRDEDKTWGYAARKRMNGGKKLPTTRTNQLGFQPSEVKIITPYKHKESNENLDTVQYRKRITPKLRGIGFQVAWRYPA